MPAISQKQPPSSPSIKSNSIVSASKSPPPSWQTAEYGKWLAKIHSDDPVITAMKHNPSPERLALDAQAQDELHRLNKNQLSNLLFTVDSDQRCLYVALSLVNNLYQENSTFRRLINHFSDMSAGHQNQCKLVAGDVYSMTVTDEQIEAAGEKLLTIVLDQDGQPSPAGDISARRAMTHELLHHITRICDDNSPDNPRGTIVEYTNIVLANREKAREAYGERSGRDAHSPEGVGGRRERECKDLWNSAESTIAGWREQAINTIKSLPEDEIAALRSQLPNLDRMLREASHDDFSALHREVVSLCNTLKNPSHQLLASINDFESKRREINTKISLTEYRAEIISEKITLNEKKDFDLAILASVSHGNGRNPYRMRCKQGDLEQVHRRDRDRAERDQKSEELKAESTMSIAQTNALQPRNRLVMVKTEYVVKTTKGILVNDTSGVSANREHGLKALKDVSGAPLNTNAPSHVKTVKTETPTFQKYVVTEEVGVTANADGKFSTRDLKSFAGTGSNHSTVISSKNRTDDGIEIIRGHIVETTRGSTSYSSTRELSVLASAFLAPRYIAEEKKDYLADYQHPDSITRRTDTSLMQFSRPERESAQHRNLTALRRPAPLHPEALSFSARLHTTTKQMNVAAFPLTQRLPVPTKQHNSNMSEASRAPIAPLAAPNLMLNKRPSGQSPVLPAIRGVEVGAGAVAGASAGRLAAYSSPTVIALPMEGVTLRADGTPEIKLNGYQFRVTFNHDAGTWCTADGASRLAYDGKSWRRLAPNEAIPPQRTGSAPSDAKNVTVTLPSIRAVPADIKPIPKDIHYTWIGGRMSEINIKNIISNAQQSFDKKTCNGYRTVLHVDANDPAIHAEIAAHFDGVGVHMVVENLRTSDFFKAFVQTKFGQQYEAARNGKYPCYAAASDVLRYQLINHAGGVYIDVDDTIQENVAFSDLPASSNDLLLHELASNAELGMTDQFNNNTLGSHPNNPLLNEISERSYARFREDPSFFNRKRPYLSNPGSIGASHDHAKHMKTYAAKISAFAGPALLDTVLRERVPDAYNLREIENALNSISLPSDYLAARTRSHEHYHPFGSLWNVTAGGDHSWQST